MSRSPGRRLAAALAVLASTAALGGCALLGALGGGGGDPAQLYRFGSAPTAEAVPPQPADAPTVRFAALVFDRAAEGDRLLAVTGNEAAYIADSRWVAPARDLFARAAERAFDRAGVRLARRDQPIANEASLLLEVPAFEARYDNGEAAAPVVVVEIRASLLRGRTRDLVAETAYVARVRAGDNRVGAIVAAYDLATREALDRISAWAVANVPAAAAPAA